MIVTHEQAKALGYCNAGLRRWFEGREISFDTFRRDGATDEWLLSTGDAMAQRLVEFAREQAAQQDKD